MHTDRDRTARWLKRLLVKGVERRNWFRLTEEFQDPDLLSRQGVSTLRAVGDLSPDTAARLREGVPDEEVEAELLSMDQVGARLCTRFDGGFPYLLSQMSLPPMAVYVAGDLVAEDELAVAVVGPRTPTPYGREIARRVSVDLARAGLTVISGFAVGVDGTAHRSALEAGGRTIGVLGCGLTVNYPASHADLRIRICEGGGALLSEYPMTAPPLAGHFPPRNTLIAGLSLAVIVVEAAERSGALVTARAALDENRHVYAVPGDITRSKSRGSNALLRAGAIPLTSVDDLLEDLEDLLRGIARRLEEDGRLTHPPRLEPIRSALPVEARAGDSNDFEGTAGRSTPFSQSAFHRPPPDNPDAVLLVERIARDPMIDLGTLMAEFVPDPFDVGRLSALLLQLELAGYIRQLPGKTYVAV